MKRSVKLSDLERDLGRERTSPFVAAVGEGELVEWEGRMWTVLLVAPKRDIVLLEN